MRFKSLLSIDPDSNCAFALCGAPGDAGPESTPVVVLLRKLPFTEHDVTGIIEGSCIAVEQVQHNDEYSKYRVQPSGPLNEITIDVIRPATQWHIDKYSRQKSELVRESPEVYQTVTLP